MKRLDLLPPRVSLSFVSPEVEVLIQPHPTRTVELMEHEGAHSARSFHMHVRSPWILHGRMRRFFLVNSIHRRR